MYFDYFDALSGEPIYLEGIAHLKSPTLGDLRPYTGIGYQAYNLYINFLSWDKKQMLEYMSLMQYRGAKKLNKEALNLFDIITLLPQTREFCRGILSFFMLETLEWSEKNHCFITKPYGETDGETIGKIDRNNFFDVEKAILQLNYIGVGKSDAPVAHSSEDAKRLWERSQEFLKKQAEKSVNEDKAELHLSNIISKLCAVHPSYNLTNIYELTVFQLYDSFFQVGYMRSADLKERIFSNHGGEKFKFEDWLKPILPKI